MRNGHANNNNNNDVSSSEIGSSAALGGGGGGAANIVVAVRKRPKITGREDDQNDIVRCEDGGGGGGGGTSSSPSPSGAAAAAGGGGGGGGEGVSSSGGGGGNNANDAGAAGGKTVAVYEPRYRLDMTPVIEPSYFAFDHVFDETASNEAVYRECCQPLLRSVREGGGAVIFAFGQTGSGKTYTMLGGGGAPGLYGLAVTELLEMTPGDTLRASFFEVYGSKLYDLLNDRAEVRMLQDEYRNIHIVGLTERAVRSAADVEALMRSGQQLRAIGTTHANDRSSRSHAVLEIKVQLAHSGAGGGAGAGAAGGNNAETENSVSSSSAAAAPAAGSSGNAYGRMTFVDLAGSERASDTAETDAKTRREGAEINKSLLALKECIRAMATRKRHIPFRGSKLTQILRESFVGRCRTCVIATISPCQAHCEDTLNTLRYADRIKELRGAGASGLALQEAPLPCAKCGLPVFIGDRHVCRRQVVQCPHCHHSMDRAELEGHIANECREAPARCQHCGERMLRAELPRHLRRCVKAPVRCPHCNEGIPRAQMDKHSGECGAAPQKCRHCGATVPRQQLPAHEASCDAMRIACVHCLKFVRRRAMETHLASCLMNPNRAPLAHANPNNNNNNRARDNDNTPPSNVRERPRDKTAAAGGRIHNNNNNNNNAPPATPAGGAGPSSSFPASADAAAPLQLPSRSSLVPVRSPSLSSQNQSAEAAAADKPQGASPSSATNKPPAPRSRAGSTNNAVSGAASISPIKAAGYAQLHHDRTTAARAERRAPGVGGAAAARGPLSLALAGGGAGGAEVDKASRGANKPRSGAGGTPSSAPTGVAGNNNKTGNSGGSSSNNNTPSRNNKNSSAAQGQDDIRGISSGAGGGGGGAVSGSNATNTTTTHSAQCPYARFGCEAAVSRLTLDAHIQECMQQHLQMVTSYAERVEKQNKKLRRLMVSVGESLSRSVSPAPEL